MTNVELNKRLDKLAEVANKHGRSHPIVKAEKQQIDKIILQKTLEINKIKNR